MYTERMKQVVAIHGGDSYATYEEFISNFSKIVVSLEWMNFNDWKKNLQKVLGHEYEVLLPRMPNPQNAKYREWKIYFEKLLPQLNDGVILVGHSLGGVFLAKFLSEESLPIAVHATFLVSAPFDADGERTLVEFNITNDLARLSEQGGQLFLYHSDDDPVVGFAELDKFVVRLPGAVVRTFANRQHFNQAEFNELVEDIRSL